jgi:iron(III) transport system substrate-binding protein
VLVYNTELVDVTELPTSVFELTDPRWAGKIGLAPSNGSFQDFVSLMRISEGDDATALWLNDIAASGAVAYENNNAIVEAVARGEIEVGLVNHYYNVRRLSEVPDSPTANHYLAADDPGSALIVSGAASVVGGSGPGDRLIEFLLSAESQRYFADETFEYPLRLGTDPGGGLPSIEFADVSSLDFSVVGAELEGTRQMIVDAGLAG